MLPDFSLSNPQTVLTVAQEGLILVFKLAGPPLAVGLIIGLIISIFQAATQINEATLSFVPKLIAVFLVFLFIGNWMMQTIIDFFIALYNQIPIIIG